MFCPKCGSILVPKKDGSKRIFVCSCGYSDKNPEKLEIKETLVKNDSIDVVREEDEQTLPITDAECSKCKNKKAFFWLVQTRAGDEPETKFLRCTKCKHTWRDYD